MSAAEFQARGGRILQGSEAAAEIAKAPAIAQPNLPLFTVDALPNALFSVNAGLVKRESHIEQGTSIILLMFDNHLVRIERLITH